MKDKDVPVNWSYSGYGSQDKHWGFPVTSEVYKEFLHEQELKKKHFLNCYDAPRTCDSCEFYEKDKWVNELLFRDNLIFCEFIGRVCYVPGKCKNYSKKKGLII